MAPPEHEICARWLEAGGRVGMAILLATFVVYALGLLPALVAPQDLIELWKLPAERFVAATGAPTGWAWAGLLDKGDYVNMIGIAALTSVTALACAAIVPRLWRDGRRLQAACALLQVVVLVAAASGIV